MDTVRYRAFVTAAEKGTIKEAAEEMGYTSSAISQLIKALEEELDTELLVRSRTGVTLTSGGVTLLPVAREILAQEEKLYQTAADLNGLLTGRLTIAAYPSIATKWLPYLIQRFQDEHPGVIFALREGSWEDMYGWVEERSVDLAFIADASDTPYDWVPLATDELVELLRLVLVALVGVHLVMADALQDAGGGRLLFVGADAPQGVKHGADAHERVVALFVPLLDVRRQPALLQACVQFFPP